MSSGVNIDTVTVAWFASETTTRRQTFINNVAGIDEQAAAVGDPANDSTLRAMLETAIGLLQREVVGIGNSSSELSTHLMSIAESFPNLDVELAGVPDGDGM